MSCLSHHPTGAHLGTSCLAEMDSDGNGELSYDEVKRGLREAKYALSDAEVAQLFQSVDIDGTGEQFSFPCS